MSPTRTYGRMEALRKAHPMWPTADLRAALDAEAREDAKRMGGER